MLCQIWTKYISNCLSLLWWTWHTEMLLNYCLDPRILHSCQLALTCSYLPAKALLRLYIKALKTSLRLTPSATWIYREALSLELVHPTQGTVRWQCSWMGGYFFTQVTQDLILAPLDIRKRLGLMPWHIQGFPHSFLGHVVKILTVMGWEMFSEHIFWAMESSSKNKKTWCWNRRVVSWLEVFKVGIYFLT